MPQPSGYLAHNPPNSPPHTAGQLTDELSSLFSETQMHFMNHYLRERSTRRISFPAPRPSHVPIIGFLSARVQELDDSITHYYSKPLMNPSDAAPHRPPFRQVAAIVLNFVIHHRTPDRTENISIPSPIYLDQSADYQTVLMSQDDTLDDELLDLFLNRLHPLQDESDAEFDFLNTTPTEWHQRYITESIQLGQHQATENLIRHISLITQAITK